MMAFMLTHDEIISNLLKRASAYAQAREIELSTLGVQIVNDGSFFNRLSSGGTCNLKTYTKVSNWLSLQSGQNSIEIGEGFSHEN